MIPKWFHLIAFFFLIFLLTHYTFSLGTCVACWKKRRPERTVMGAKRVEKNQRREGPLACLLFSSVRRAFLCNAKKTNVLATVESAIKHIIRKNLLQCLHVLCLLWKEGTVPKFYLFVFRSEKEIELKGCCFQGGQSRVWRMRNWEAIFRASAEKRGILPVWASGIRLDSRF